MTKITHELILQDVRATNNPAIHIIMMIIGVALVFLPAPYTIGYPFNMIASMVFVFLTFGMLFGVVFGLVPLIKGKAKLKAAFSGNLRIEKAIVLEKEAKKRRNRYYCELLLETHETKTREYFSKTYGYMDKIDIGDEYYVVFIGNKNTIELAYPAKEYFV